MTEEEKGIIKHVNIIIKEGLDREDNIQLILEKLLNLIQKQDKIIDLMAKSWKQDDTRTVEKIKQYFEKQAKEV